MKRIFPDRSHECKYCTKKFSSEKTLFNHMCVKKRRWKDKDTIGARLGLSVFQRYYKMNTRCKKDKTFEEFMSSNLYNGFVKFGKYLVELNPINADKFIEFVILGDFKLKDWDKDRVYNKFLKEYVVKELADKALERTIKEMSKWAEANNSSFNKFFEECNTNEAVSLIKSGRISPWVLLLASSSYHLMENMSEEHDKMLKEVLDMNFWQKKFLKDKEDTQFVLKVLGDAGL